MRDFIQKHLLNIWKWHLRPAALHLFKFLSDNFLNVNNGILSNRPLDSGPLDQEGDLHLLAPYLNSENMYSSRYVSFDEEQSEKRTQEVFLKLKVAPNKDSYQKIEVYENLRSKGHNVKIINDNPVALYIGNDGLFVRDLMLGI